MNCNDTYDVTDVEKVCEKDMTGLKYPMGTRPIQSSLSTDSSLVGA
jgi:hypothetical protein